MVVQSPHVNPKPLPIKGLVSSRPLSYGHVLTAEQEVAKKEYVVKHERKHSVKPNDTSTQEAHKIAYGQAARTDFKAQALNRRAKVFGEAM